MLSKQTTTNLCLSFSAALIFTAGCASIRPDIDYNPEQDFRQYHNYSWLVTNKDSIDKLINDLANERIVNAIENGLASRGYHKLSTDAEADFVVAYHLSVEKKFDINTVHTDMGYSPWGPSYGYRYGFGGVSQSNTTVREYKAGTLIIDIINKSDNKLAWRGTAQSRLKKNISPQERTQKINDVVNAILDEFPPL